MPIADNDLPFVVSLHAVDGIGSARLQRLLSYFGSAKNTWESSGGEWIKLGIPQKVINTVAQLKRNLIPEKYYESLCSSNIKITLLHEDSYPKTLAQIDTPPFLLYYKGNFPTSPTQIGIVGTRKITGYGKTVTEALTTDLVKAGLTIVSGLARGVDTVAHKTCIEHGGKTIAVLGGGLNTIYPPENAGLARQIELESGCILSEFPPEYPHLAGNFPARNRIIAGLSIAIIVTEAAEDSGSLITARFAAEQNKEVFAVPGPITSSLAQGPLSLIKDGAKLVSSSEDILSELGISSDKLTNDRKNELIAVLDPISNQIFEIIKNEPRHLDEISRELNLQPAQTSAILIRLEIQGLVKNIGSGIYSTAV